MDSSKPCGTGGLNTTGCLGAFTRGGYCLKVGPLYGNEFGGVKPDGGLRWKSGAYDSCGGAEYESRELLWS